MRYLSLFSGIEAATVAWHPLDWQPVAFAEIEPFPCAVLAHHYPNVPNLGDVTEITDEQIAALGRIDVVVGGSPCQDLSVAGQRKGLAGERSSLFHEQIRIFHAARHFCGARWLVWENVPGAFSSNGGGDFAVVVGAMAGCRLNVPADGWEQEGVALGEHGLLEWSVLDAQWFGLAQRRKRVFAVLDTGNWANRPPVLLERDSLRGDTAPRRESAQIATLPGGNRPDEGGREHHGCRIPETAMCLNAGAMGRRDAESETFVVHGTQDPDTLIDQAHTLGRNQGQENVVYTLASRGRPGGHNLEYRSDGTANALLTPNGGRAGMGVGAIAHQSTVRRLTPRECERLQGFPDDYTLIPWRTYRRGIRKGISVAAMVAIVQANAKALFAKSGKTRHEPDVKECPDGPRYRALGNSMAVSVMRWIGRQIDAATNFESLEQVA